MLGPEDVVGHGAPWAVSEHLLLSQISACSNIAQVDESELCHKFDSEVIDERKSTTDRIKEVGLCGLFPVPIVTNCVLSGP